MAKLFCSGPGIVALCPAIWLLGAATSFVRVAEAANPAGNLVFRAWDTSAGLPQNSVSVMRQDREGYLWLGTRDGLARFDGVRFRVFGLEQGLQSVDIQSLLEDGQGTLWIGSSGGGLARLCKGEIEIVPVATRRAGSDIITALAEDLTGRLWVGTRAGLRFLQHGRLVEDDAFGDLSSAPVRALLSDQHGTMWISTSSHGLFAWEGGRLTPMTGPLPDPRIIAHCLLEDQRGWLWASIGNGMVLCRQAGTWQVFNETHGLPFAYISCLAEDAEGTVWAGSLDDGLYYFDGQRFHVVRQRDGLSANDIRSLLLDRESNLWVGTRTGGLNRLNRRRLLHCGAAQGLTNDFTRAVAQTVDGELWIATTGGGVYRGDLRVFAPFRPDPVGGYFAHIDTVLAARDGSVWWGGVNGLLRWHQDRLTHCVTNEPWVQATSITALQEDNEGGLWIGTQQSRLIHFHEGRFEEFPQRVARGPITALAVQPDGQVWVGSVGGGLRRLGEGNVNVMTVTNGLLSHSILTLYLDADRTLWIGTAGGGLSRWRDGGVISYTQAHGLSARTVSQIVDDELGHLWLGTSRGIVKVHKEDLNDCAAGRASFVRSRFYGVNDGLPAEECSGGFCPAGLKTREGWVCFSSVKGLVLLNPREESSAAPPPRVLIEEVLVNGQPQLINWQEPEYRDPAVPAVQDHIVIPPGGRAIELQYTAIQFRSPERVSFRHRLEGVDMEWIEAGGRRTANYQGLGPGKYSFRVKASNAEGVWGDHETALTLFVHPFLHETAWFRTGIVVAVTGTIGGALWFLLRRRYRTRLTRLQMQHAVARERLRISQDMHDHVGGILTQVTQLSDMGLGEAAEAVLARSRFERIGNQTRLAVQAMDEIVWATNPKNDNLASFADYVSRFTDEYFEGTPVRCWQEVPTSLPDRLLRADVRHDVFLALKEAAHNVLKHAQATEVWLRVSLSGDLVLLELQDNGTGFAPDRVASGGNGLGNMRARVTGHGGAMELVSAPARGTTVRLSFPLTLTA